MNSTFMFNNFSEKQKGRFLGESNNRTNTESCMQRVYGILQAVLMFLISLWVDKDLDNLWQKQKKERKEAKMTFYKAPGSETLL